MRLSRAMLVGVVSAVMLATVASLGGCVVNATYPPRPGESATSDLNIAPGPSVIEAGLRAALERRPVEGAFVLNLPEGMELMVAERIARSVAGDRAVLPSRGDVSGLPVVHVSRVWIRADHAEVDVLLPFEGTWRAVTAQMQGGVAQGYRILRVKEWPPGMIQPPPLYGWGTSEPDTISDDQVGGAPGATESEPMPDEVDMDESQE